VFEDGDEEVDGGGRGLDAALVAVALGGIDLLSTASSCCCPAMRPSSTSAVGVNRLGAGWRSVRPRAGRTR
jgi:hypothetical protein